MSMYVFWIIVLSGLGTLLLRIIPFMAISKMNLSEGFVKWLSFIPITLFAALVIDGMLLQDNGQNGYTFNWIFLMSLIPTVIATLITRSLTISVVVGIISVAILRLVIPI